MSAGALELNNSALKDVFSSSLKAYWRLEDGLTDSSGNAHTLTNNNAAVFADAKFGRGIDLERGSTQYLSVADHADFDMGTGPFTIGAWVKRESAGIFAGILSNVTSGDASGFRLDFTSTDTIEFFVAAAAGSDNAVTTTTFPSTSIFYHIVGVRDGSTLKIYVNGKQEASVASTPRNCDSTTALTIGPYRGGDPTSNLFDGIVDDVFILKGVALTVDQVRELYEGRTVGELWPAYTSNIQALYHLSNETDGSGNANNLTNNNSVAFNPAKFGKGADFGSSNTNKSLSIASDLGITGGNITMCAWVKCLTDIPDGATWYFVAQEDATNDIQYSLAYVRSGSTRTLEFRRYRQGVAAVAVSFNLDLGTSSFYNLFLTYNGTNLEGFLNGVKVGTVATSGNGSGITASSFSIGNQRGLASGNSFYASAVIDEVAVFSRVFTAQEIKNYYAWALGRRTLIA